MRLFTMCDLKKTKVDVWLLCITPSIPCSKLVNRRHQSCYGSMVATTTDAVPTLSLHRFNVRSLLG